MMDTEQKRMLMDADLFGAFFKISDGRDAASAVQLAPYQTGHPTTKRTKKNYPIPKSVSDVQDYLTKVEFEIEACCLSFARARLGRDTRTCSSAARRSWPSR